MSASPGCAAAAVVRRGTPSAAGVGTCPGTRSMPSAAAPVPGTCSATRTPWSASTSTPSHAGRKKFHIRKGYVTTRNKYMRCEKLFTGFDLCSGRFLTVRATPGNCELARPGGAADAAGAGVRAGRAACTRCSTPGRASPTPACGRCGTWPSSTANLDVTLRACRYPHRLRPGSNCPAACSCRVEEPGVCVGRPAQGDPPGRDADRAEGREPEQAVRTIVCREIAPGSQEGSLASAVHDRAALEPEDVLPMFRQRQHHEQAYRVGVHDLGLDAVPCGYDKESPDRQRPRFQRGPLQMIGWLVALVYNAVADLADALGEDHAGEHVRTLRRKFFNRPGQLYETPEALIVYLDRFAGQDELLPLIDELNAGKHRLPWLENRRLVMSLTPTSHARAGP